MNNCMDKNAKIYIAGHKGLVGSALTANLKSRGYTNLILRDSKELDLRSQSATESFFARERPEYVFLAAARVGGISANNTYRADFIYQNLMIQNNIIYFSYKYGVNKLLFLGSTCIYPREAPQPMSEDSLLTSPLEYTNEPYAIAKIAGIKLCESFNIQYGTNFISVMPTNLYGPNDNFDLEKSHVLPALIRKMHLGKLLAEENFERIFSDLNIPDRDTAIRYLNRYGVTSDTVEIWGSGKPRREFLWSADLADACVFLMNKVNFADLSRGLTEIRNTHINIGTGQDISISELSFLIKEIVGFSGKLKFNKDKPDGTMQKLTRVDKLHSLGWHHSVTLEQGIKKLYALYLGNQRSKINC